MTKRKKIADPPLPARSVVFECENCEAQKTVKLAVGESTPTRVDCDECETRDSGLPVA